MAKRVLNSVNEDGTIYCAKCKDNFSEDHFYKYIRSTGKVQYNCRNGRQKKKKSKLTLLQESLGVKRKKDSKALFHIPMEDGRIYCGDCKQLFQEDHFHIVKYENRKYNNSNVIQYTCKSHDIRFSELNPDRLYKSNYKNSPRDYKRDAMLQREYGITLDEYFEMLEKQNYSCDICNISQKDLKKPLFVDHCHKTGKVRGLLCNNCNWTLGLMKDNPEYLNNAILYLKKNSNE